MARKCNLTLVRNWPSIRKDEKKRHISLIASHTIKQEVRERYYLDSSEPTSDDEFTNAIQRDDAVPLNCALESPEARVTSTAFVRKHSDITGSDLARRPRIKFATFVSDSGYTAVLPRNEVFSSLLHAASFCLRPR
ncbi:hypothetical protein ISCGN_000879 [Ixodes scapularis]